MQKLHSCIFAATALFAASFTASGAPITGILGIGGSSATVGATSVGLNCSAGIPLASCPGPGGNGNFNTTGGSTGSFTPYIGGGGYIAPLTAAQPLNTPFVYNNFVSFSGSAGNPVMPPDIRLDLSFIYLGTSGQAECGLAESAGQTCTPIIPSLVGPNNPTGLSSYDFTNTATGSTLSISLSGTATRISTNETTQFIGLLQVTFVGMSFQDVMSQLSANNYTGTVMTPYSATFTALVGPGQQGEVPEPTFLIPLGGALVGIAGIQRRRRAKTA